MSSKLMEKKALDPISAGLLAMGGAAAKGHLAGNVLARSAMKGTNLAEMMAHQGLQHALADSVVNPASLNSIKMLFGPEATVAYETAHNLGSRIAAMPPEARKLSLMGLSKGVNLDNAPVLKEIAQAAQHELAGTAPEFISQSNLGSMYARPVNFLMKNVNTPFDTAAQRAVKNTIGASNMAVPAVLDPTGGFALAGHAGVNALRSAVGKSDLVKNMAVDQFAEGLAGKLPGTLERNVKEIGLSPAYYEAQDVGYSLRNALPESIRNSLTPESVNAFKDAAKAVRSSAAAHRDLMNLANSVPAEMRNAVISDALKNNPELKELIQQGVRAAGEMSPELQQALGAAEGQIGDFLRNLGPLSEAAGEGLGQAASKVRDIAGAAGEAASNLGTRAREAAGAAGEAASNLGTRAREAAGAAGEAASNLGARAREAVGAVPGAVEQAAESARGAAGSAAESLRGAAGAAQERVQGAVGAASDAAASARERARQAWFNRQSAPAPEATPAPPPPPPPTPEPAPATAAPKPRSPWVQYGVPLGVGAGLGTGGVLGYQALSQDNNPPQLKAASILRMYKTAGTRAAFRELGLGN